MSSKEPGASTAAPVPDPRVTAAERDLERARRIEEDLLAEYEQATIDLEAAEGSIGDRLLAARASGEGGESLNHDHSKVWLKVDTSRRATKAAHRARVLAEAGVLEAQAVVSTDEGARVKAELEEHGKRIMEHLKAIREIDGYPHQLHPPAVPHLGYTGPVSRSSTMMEQYQEASTRARTLGEQAARLRAAADIDPGPG